MNLIEPVEQEQKDLVFGPGDTVRVLLRRWKENGKGFKS